MTTLCCRHPGWPRRCRRGFGDPLITMELTADAPIGDPQQDLLDRSDLVRELALSVGSAPASRGFVIGLTGRWGSGKTSILNLVERELEEQRIIFWFEPWLFSGAEELVDRFFVELASKLEASGSPRLKRIGKASAEYGEALSPLASLVSPRLGTALRITGHFAKGKKSAIAKRDRISNLLSELDQPIVVFVDDLDRLDPKDAREVMRLVRLVGDLPNLLYVLAYDQTITERNLEISGVEDGASYLEKIVQVTVGIPPISPERAGELALQFLKEALPESDLVAWNDRVWSDIFSNAMGSYFETLRDARRFANSAPIAARLCEGEVASMDVLALEAIRIFDPQVHAKLPEMTGELAPTLVDWIPFDEEARKDRSNERVVELLADAKCETVTRKVLAKLFPRLAEILGQSGPEIEPDDAQTERRVSSAPVLHQYIHNRLPTNEVPAHVVDEALQSMANAEAFQNVLDDVDGALLPSLLARMARSVGQVAEMDEQGCCAALVNVIPRIEGNYGIFDMEPYLQVSRLIEIIFERMPTVDARVDLAADTLEAAPDFTTKAELFRRWREPENGPSGHSELDLFTGEMLQRIESDLAAQVMASDLADESNAFWVLGFVERQQGKEAVLTKVREPGVLLATLRSYGTELRPFTGGGEVFRLEHLVDRAGASVVDDVRSLASSGALTAQEKVSLERAISEYDAREAARTETPQPEE